MDIDTAAIQTNVESIIKPNFTHITVQPSQVTNLNQPTGRHLSPAPKTISQHPMAQLPPLPPHKPVTANEQLIEPRQSNREKKPARHKAKIDEVYERPQHLKSNRRLTLQSMVEHLETVYIRPQNMPSASNEPSEVPDTLPEPMHPVPYHAQVIDLNDSSWSQTALNALTASNRDHFAGLLTNQPPAPADALGYFTGQQLYIQNSGGRGGGGGGRYRNNGTKNKDQVLAASARSPPPKRKFTAGTSVEMIPVIHAALGNNKDLEWSLLGKKQPRLYELDITVKGLWDAVRSLGGCYSVNQFKQWNNVRRLMGPLPEGQTYMTKNARQLYYKYLLAYEFYVDKKVSAEEAVEMAKEATARDLGVPYDDGDAIERE